MTPIVVPLNALIRTCRAPARKWLQLKLFHFLATRAWVYNLGENAVHYLCAAAQEPI